MSFEETKELFEHFHNFKYHSYEYGVVFGIYLSLKKNNQKYLLDTFLIIVLAQLNNIQSMIFENNLLIAYF